MGCLLHCYTYYHNNVFTMSNKHPRINRESHTIASMIQLYCRERHSSDILCPECTMLMKYARKRLDKCPYQAGKTTCAKCPVHCYKPDTREKIKAVMRYSGPRMLYRHPVLTVYHFIDKLRKEPLRHPEKSPLPRG